MFPRTHQKILTLTIISKAGVAKAVHMGYATAIGDWFNYEQYCSDIILLRYPTMVVYWRYHEKIWFNWSSNTSWWLL